jgi:hypothetical protein
MDISEVVDSEARKSSGNNNVTDSGGHSVAARDRQPASLPLLIPPTGSASRPSHPPTSTALQTALLSQAPEIQRKTGHNASLGSSNVPDSTHLAQQPLVQGLTNPPVVSGPLVYGSQLVTVENTKLGKKSPWFLYGISAAMGSASMLSPIGPSTTAAGTLP